MEAWPQGGEGRGGGCRVTPASHYVRPRWRPSTGRCTRPWPSHLCGTTCPSPGPPWHTSRRSTSAPWPITTQPWHSATVPVSAPPARLCPFQAPAGGAHRPLSPQQRPRRTSPRGSRPYVGARPHRSRSCGALGCPRSRRNAGSWVRQPWGGVPAEGPECPILAESRRPGMPGVPACPAGPLLPSCLSPARGRLPEQAGARQGAWACAGARRRLLLRGPASHKGQCTPQDGPRSPRLSPACCVQGRGGAGVWSLGPGGDPRREVCPVPHRQGPPEAQHPGPGGGPAAARGGPCPAHGRPAAGRAGPGAEALPGPVLGARPRGRLPGDHGGSRHPA